MIRFLVNEWHFLHFSGKENKIICKLKNSFSSDWNFFFLKIRELFSICQTNYTQWITWKNPQRKNPCMIWFQKINPHLEAYPFMLLFKYNQSNNFCPEVAKSLISQLPLWVDCLTISWTTWLPKYEFTNSSVLRSTYFAQHDVKNKQNNNRNSPT